MMIDLGWTCLWSCSTDWCRQWHTFQLQPWVHSNFTLCRRPLRHSDDQSLKNQAQVGHVVRLIYFNLLLASLLWNIPMLRIMAWPFHRLGFCQRKFSWKNARRTVHKYPSQISWWWATFAHFPSVEPPTVRLAAHCIVRYVPFSTELVWSRPWI